MRPEERIAIDGVPVDGAAFDRAIEDVLAVEAACLADGRLAERATFFEAMTAVAYELLRRARVDVAVIEVGLGGRLDATNVCDPVATAIVSVDLDHQAWLGDTRAAIAAEKAAIARPGVPLVVGDLTDEALDAVVAAAEAAGAPLVYAAEGVECVVSGAADGRLTITLDTATRTYGPVRLALAGEHQVANAFVAVALLEALDDAGIHVDRRAVETGLADTRWPGRLDRVALPDGRRALLDAAHNAAGARALAAWLVRTTPADAAALVFAAAGDKDVAGMIRALAPAVGDIVVTAFADARAIAADALAVQVRAALAEAGGRVERVHVAATTGRGARDGVAALARHRRRRIDLPARRSLSAHRPARPVRGWPIRSGLVRHGELSRMAVLSCGVVPAGSRPLVRALVALVFLIVTASRAGAQAPSRRRPAATDIRLGSAARQERLGLHHIRYSGAVEIELVAQGIRFSADVADYYDDQHRLVAVGNVVFVTPSSRISADKADFDTRSRTGTFFNAFGSASVSDKVDKSFFGGQEPDAFFYGETIEKIGVDRYRIHKGGVHDLRPADAALGSRRRHGHADRRQARRAEERRPQGQGRAAVLRPGDVLPDQQGGPLDRLPAARLRHVDHPRHVVQQRLLLGHQPQPGPDR